MGKEEMKITTRLAKDPATCRFSISPPIYNGGTVFFRNKEDAQGSPLAEAIFAIESVVSVKFKQEGLSVTRDKPDDWPSVTRKVAACVKDHAATGKPPLKEGVPSNMPSSEEIRKKAAEILETQVNPAVAAHGGVISLIDVKGATVYLKLGGGCQGCGQADVTLKQGVERSFRDAIPELDDILDVTDHASGTNPYFEPSKK